MNVELLFPSEYLRCCDLREQEWTLTISKVQQDELFRPPSKHDKKGGKEKCPVVYLKESPKKWVLNKTNARAIKKMLGTGETNDWVGAQVTVFPTTCMAFGDQVDCIRVKAAKRATEASRKSAAPPNRITPEHQAEIMQRASNRGLDESALANILGSFGAETIGELKDSDYEKVLAEIG